MNDLKERLFPNTRISSLLILKPISLEWLAVRGINPFQGLDATLEQVCGRLGMGWEELLEALGKLETPDKDSDWHNLPLSHLLEYLTREHNEFRQVFIPAIRSAFAAGEGKRDFLGPLHPVVKAWPDFSASMLEHIGSEESVIFPKILRDQYRIQHGEPATSALFDSSLAYPSLLLLRKEDEHLETLSGFLDAASFCRSPESLEIPAISAFRLLRHFHGRLSEHSRLERNVLLPMVAAQEKNLREHPPAGLLFSNA